MRQHQHSSLLLCFCWATINKYPFWTSLRKAKESTLLVSRLQVNDWVTGSSDVARRRSSNGPSRYYRSSVGRKSLVPWAPMDPRWKRAREKSKIGAWCIMRLWNKYKENNINKNMYIIYFYIVSKLSSYVMLLVELLVHFGPQVRDAKAATRRHAIRA